MSGLLSLIGWTFLPNLVTNWVQAIYYGITIRAGEPKPQPGTAQHAEHRRRIYIAVVTVYLLYTIYEADYELRREGSFYSALSLPPNATEKEVKSRFRRLAALYHPDKVGAGGGAGGSPSPEQASAYFIRLKTASETLTDPARRFAYDRFGPDVVGWQRCVTVRDFVMQGLRGLAPMYVGAGSFMCFLEYMGYLEWGRSWRWIAFLAVLLFEVTVVTRPHGPFLFERVINPALALLPGAAAHAHTRNPYLPFQAVSLARKVSVTVSVALSQIGPMLGADTSSGRVVVRDKGAKEEQRLMQAVEQLERTARAIDDDAGNLLGMEVVPFSSDQEVMDGMQAKMKEWLVQNTIRADPMVRDALGNSLRKRRVDAPFGAKGTR